ncbi:MAG: hypothetical protein JKP98_16030 [Rhodobacteraceae bacterium]|nr:hypothetical protein [Paracoccaceae bacterium]
MRQAESLAGLGAFFEENGLPPDPAMLGLGAFHVAEGPLWALAADAARAALGAVGRIDALILCSSRFPGETADHAEGMRGLLAETGIEPSFVAGVTLNRCASFLTGIRLAASLVATGQAESCLVVTADRFTGDAERLRPFALFSDGAAACVIGAAPGDGPAYRVAGPAVPSTGTACPRPRGLHPGWCNAPTGRSKRCRVSPSRSIARFCRPTSIRPSPSWPRRRAARPRPPSLTRTSPAGAMSSPPIR